MASTLPTPALQASRAAINAALSDQNNNDDIEPGEIQEIDMEEQAEGIRTVFSDPKNFNVKVASNVSFFSRFRNIQHLDSIPSILRGLSGSTLQPLKVAIYLRLP
jgi:hypothetical protein